MSDHLYAAARQQVLRSYGGEVLEALTAAVPGRMPGQLRDYWTHGEGAAKIRWGTDGSFDRCVRLLRKYFKADPKGLCAKLHKAATGEWPAEKGVQSSAGWSAPSPTEVAFHLPGKHNQESHGNRVGKPGNVHSATGIGARIRTEAEAAGRRALAEEPEHLDALRQSIQRARAKVKIKGVKQEGPPIADLTAPGAAGLRVLEKHIGDGDKVKQSNLPSATKGGINGNTLDNLRMKGFITSKYEDSEAGSWDRTIRLTDKGREALAALKAGGVPAGVAKETRPRSTAAEKARAKILNPNKSNQEDGKAYRDAVWDFDRPKLDADLLSIEAASKDPANREGKDGYLIKVDGLSRDDAEDLFRRHLVTSVMIGPLANFDDRDEDRDPNDKTIRVGLGPLGRSYLDTLHNEATQVQASPDVPQPTPAERERLARLVLGDKRYEQDLRNGRLMPSMRPPGMTAHAGPIADLADLEDDLAEAAAIGEEFGFNPAQKRAADGKWTGGAAKDAEQQETEKGMSAAEKGKALSDAEFVKMVTEQQRLKPGDKPSPEYRKLRARWDAMMKKDPGVMIEMMTRTRKARAAAGKAKPVTKKAATAAHSIEEDPMPDLVTAHAGPHDDEEVASMDAALADLDEPDAYAESIMPMVTRWSGMLAPIGKPTGDRRIFEAGALKNRDLPLPLMWQEKTDDGHARSSVVGTIEEIEHREDGTYGAGHFLDQDLFPDVTRAKSLLRARVNGPSVDLDDVTYALKNADGTAFDAATFEAETMAGNNPAKPLLSISDGRVSGATLVSIPAFAEVAHTWQLEDVPDEDGFSAALAEDMEECDDCFQEAALSAAGYVGPPLSAFLPREFTGPTPMTVAEDGTVYGHLATWSTCHVGFQDACVTPPNSKTAYAYFHTGEVTTAEGERLPVGRLVLGTPHADLAKGFRAAAQHYDETGRVCAVVRAYEDAYGIAFSGVLVHDLTPEQRAEFRAMPLSGDWRRVGGNLELVGAISVPVPGFPVARSEGSAPAALVAAGVVHTLDAQPVDTAPVTFAGGTITVNFSDVPPEVFEMLTGQRVAREEQAAEAAGPDASADFAAQVDAAMEALADTLDRERMALLDNIPTLGE